MRTQNVSEQHQGIGKRGHIVADTLLLNDVSWLRKLVNICCRHKMLFRNIFVSRGQTRKHLCRQQYVLVCQYLQKRYWQTRTHCCEHIVAHDVALRAQTGKHLLRTQNVSEQNQKQFCVPDTKFVSQQMLRAQANGETFVSATMCPQQCVLVCQYLNIFCVPDTKFVSATNVTRAGKRGNICVGKNVSSFARALYSFNSDKQSK